MVNLFDSRIWIVSILALSIFCKRSLQVRLMDLDLNKEPPIEPTTGQQHTHDSINLNEVPLSHSKEVQIGQTQQDSKSKHDNRPSKRRYVPRNRNFKGSETIVEAKKQSRIKAREATKGANLEPGTDKFERMYKNTYEKALRAMKVTPTRVQTLTGEKLKAHREKHKIKSANVRESIRQRKKDGKMTPEDRLYYQKAIERKRKSREKKKQEKLRQQNMMTS